MLCVMHLPHSSARTYQFLQAILILWQAGGNMELAAESCGDLDNVTPSSSAVDASMTNQLINEYWLYSEVQ